MGEEEQAPTELVAGKYRLTKLLGRGGMGSVWEGVHQTLGTRVACKFIEAEYANSAEARSRFENEARAAAALRSKHVVDVYDHGVMSDGRPYIVMEYLSGEPLDARLDRVGRLSLAETSAIVSQVARGLSRAHKAGIVHRDLKPENVFLVWDDEDHTDVVKVVDFGIAKFTDNAVGISSATRTGSVLGTPYYMSPEQARGLRTVDHRSDLWSVGVIAFRCVVGRLPFEGEALGDLLVQICTGPVPVPSQLLPGLPPAFDAWAARALSREPEDRFPDARAMADELAVAAGGQARAAMASVADPDASGPVQAVSGFGQPTPPPGAVTAVDTSAGGGVTNIGLSATTAPNRASKTPLVAGLAAGVLVLGVGIALAAKVMGEPTESAAATALSASVEAVVPQQATVPEAPKVEPAAPAKEPSPNDAEAEAKPEQAPKAEKAAAPAKKPAPRPRSTQRVTKPVTTKPVVKEEVAPPPPKPPPPKPPRSTPKKPATRQGIDLGY